jgi:uncharacterized RDD family membrane protein YckC
MSTFNYGRASSAGDLAATYSAGTAVGLRWAATIVDFILILIVVGVTLSVLNNVAPGTGVFVALALVSAYYVAMEGLLGQTIGKMLLRIKVVDESGNVPGIGKAIIRTLLRLIEINPILMGGIPAGVVVYSSSKRQRLGDMLAHTYVLRVADAEGVRMGTAVLPTGYAPQGPPYGPGGAPQPGYPLPPGPGFPSPYGPGSGAPPAGAATYPPPPTADYPPPPDPSVSPASAPDAPPPPAAGGPPG